MAENLDRDTHKGIFEIITIYLHVVDPGDQDKRIVKEHQRIGRRVWSPLWLSTLALVYS